jgi:hypothetical protein
MLRHVYLSVRLACKHAATRELLNRNSGNLVLEKVIEIFCVLQFVLKPDEKNGHVAKRFTTFSAHPAQYVL